MSLTERFPDVPREVLWKAELLFRGVKFTDALAAAVTEGAAPNFWPYRRKDEAGKQQAIPVPYLFRLENGGVARVRVDDRSAYAVRRDVADDPFQLTHEDASLCRVEFVRSHAWQDYRTRDGLSAFEAGVEQLGDMIVVNISPGCEYFRVSAEDGRSMRCSFCAYGRFDRRSLMLGQKQGEVELDPALITRLGEVLEVVVERGGGHHVYINGGSVLDPRDEARRYLPIVEAVRRAVGDRLRVTIGCGAVDPDDAARFRDAGADSACHNLEVWDPETFRACCPGKEHYVGRQRWIDGLLGAVEVFGRGNVGSAMVAGLELRPPAPGMAFDRMVASIREGAAFLLDHGIVPLYSPLWPVEGTAYGPTDGITAEEYVTIEREVYRLRAERSFPVPSWLLCPGCSYMLLEVDFDRAFGLREALT